MAGGSSLVVHDPSGELYLKSSQYMFNQGYAVKVLNYTQTEISEEYNPLSRITTLSDIKKIAKLLIQTSLGGGGKDPFWNESASNILTLFIRYVIFHTGEKYHTLSYVLSLINDCSGSPKKVDTLIVETKDESLLAEYKSFVGYDSKMLMSIVATTQTALALFADPEIATITKADTINFTDFRKQKTILYINSDINNLKYYSVLSSLFFEQFFASIMKQLPTTNELPIFFLLDESSSLYLNILPIAISNIRKYNAGMLQIYQSQSQLFDLYGMAQGRNILANSYAKCYLPGQPLETARELQSILGSFEYVDENETKRTRPLLTMDEIRILKEAIILLGNHPAIKTKLIPYYEHTQFKHCAHLPPYTIPKKGIIEDMKRADETEA